jgi:hypothetical protein
VISNDARIKHGQTSHSYCSWYISQDCHMPHHNFYGTVGSEGSVTRDIEKNRAESQKDRINSICLVEVLSSQLGKLLPRERFENDISLIHVVETNRILESYLKIRQYVPREISILSTRSPRFISSEFCNDCANVFSSVWFGKVWGGVNTIFKGSSPYLNA